jgi:hypothetical protein
MVRCLALLFAAGLLLVACGRRTLPADLAAANSQLPAAGFRAQQLAQLPALPAPHGVKPETWDQLKAALAAAIEAQDKAVRAAPVSDGSRSMLTYDPVDHEMIWDYACQGDYDQNSEVNISDLTPLAVHLGEGDGTPFARTSLLSVIDGDGNGQITIADITPLGVNLGRRVAAYELYESVRLTAVPPDNGGSAGPGTTFFASVPFGEFQGVPNAGRLSFGAGLPAVPEPGTVLWLRPVDSTTSGTPSNAVLVPGWKYVTLDGVTSDGPITLAVVNGHPALAYSANSDISYCRATSRDGGQLDDWDNRVVIQHEHVYGKGLSLAIIGGHPALSFCRSVAGGNILCYVRSTTASGAAAGNWVNVREDLAAAGVGFSGNNGQCSSLSEVGGTPAISFVDAGGHVLGYAHSADVDGAPGSWLAQVIGAGCITQQTSLKVVAGRPCVSWSSTTDLSFSRAGSDSGDGAPWGLALLDSAGVVFGDTSLALVDGKPAIAYGVMLGGPFEVRYAYSATGDGQIAADWSHEVVWPGLNSANVLSLGLVNGEPAIAAHTDTFLSFARRRTLGPGVHSWDDKQGLTDFGETVADVSVAEVDGRPAVAFARGAGSRLVQYAILY